VIERIEPGPRMSQVVVHRGTAYVSGQVPTDPAADIAVQTQQVLAKIDALLARAGCDRSRLLRADIFLADIADFAAMNAVWEAWIAPGQPPARATVQAALARPEWKVEIVVVAALG
jgi:enamine deaminase RidA (YjgF/YER057c/UK114 family)